MKTFLRHRTADEVIAQCRALGLNIDTGPYERGSDHLRIWSEAVDLCYSVVNGRFFGDTVVGSYFDERITFNSDVDRPEDWYQALLEFFYTNEPVKEAA